MTIDSFFIFNIFSKLALPISAYLLVANVNHGTNDFRKTMTFVGSLAILTQIIIFFISMYYSQFIFNTLSIFAFFSAHSPLLLFFNEGNFFHVLFLGLCVIATYKKLKTKQHQIRAFIPFALTFGIFIILNLLPLFYPNLNGQLIREGNNIFNSSIYRYIVELLTTPLFIIGIILTNLSINRLPNIDINKSEKSKKPYNILILTLMVFMYSTVWSSSSYIFLGITLILCLHIASEKNFGHIKTIAIVMFGYYLFSILIQFIFFEPEWIPTIVVQILFSILVPMSFSMLGILLIRIFNISSDQIERGYTANIIGSIIYPLAIISIYFGFMIS